jgi:hypothetical protein
VLKSSKLKKKKEKKKEVYGGAYLYINIKVEAIAIFLSFGMYDNAFYLTRVILVGQIKPCGRILLVTYLLRVKILNYYKILYGILKLLLK